MKPLNSHPDTTTVATPSTSPKSKLLSVKFATVLLMAISPLALQGAVVVTGGAPTTFAVDNYDDLGAGFSYTVQNTDSVLVIGFYTDFQNGPSGVTFGGIAPDNFLVGSRMGIAYWANPDTGAGAFAVSGINGAQAFLAGVYELAGVDLDAVVTGTSNGTSTNTITTPTANEFVISYAASNNTAAITTGASSIIGLDIGIQPPTGTITAYLAGGTGLAGAAGAQDVTWDNEDRGSLNYSFQAVPEPSSFALLAGCFGLTWVMVRRRA